MRNIHHHESESRPFLSICIPTWNRADKLARKIRSLESVIDENIELIVVDNGSSDNTRSVLDDVARLHPNANFSFWTNEVNLGADVNYLRVLELGRGDWLWLNDDDELLDVRLIETLVEQLADRQGVVLLPMPPYRLDHVALPKVITLAEFMQPRFDAWGHALHQIGFFLLERDRCLPFLRAAYADGVGNLHAYVFLSYGMLASGLPLNVIDVPGLARGAVDPTDEAPRWNRLAGHLAAWRSSEQALPGYLRHARARERRTRAGALVLGTIFQLAEGKRLPRGLLVWQLRRLPWYMQPVVAGLGLVDRLPISASQTIGRILMKLTGRTIPNEHDAAHGY